MQNFYLSQGDAQETTCHWKENSEKDWVDNLQSLIQKKPFGDHKFYVFMFVKMVDNATGVKKMYMQPRLTKPEPLPGTTLLQVDPREPGDALMIWTLPSNINADLFKEGRAYSDQFVHECIDNYLHHPWKLMKKEEGELSENEIREIYKAKAKGNSSTKRTEFNKYRGGKD